MVAHAHKKQQNHTTPHKHFLPFLCRPTVCCILTPLHSLTSTRSLVLFVCVCVCVCVRVCVCVWARSRHHPNNPSLLACLLARFNQLPTHHSPFFFLALLTFGQPVGLFAIPGKNLLLSPPPVPYSSTSLVVSARSGSKTRFHFPNTFIG